MPVEMIERSKKQRYMEIEHSDLLLKYYTFSALTWAKNGR
jgi:hypothetical protein